MRRATIAALVGAWLTLTVWSAARAGETGPAISVIYEQAGVEIEAEVRGLGIVQLQPIEQGETAGAQWASLAVLADVGPAYEIRVRARAGEAVSEWSPWRAMQGPVADTCEGREGASDGISLRDVLWVLGRVNQPGRVCVR